MYSDVEKEVESTVSDADNSKESETHGINRIDNKTVAKREEKENEKENNHNKTSKSEDRRQGSIKKWKEEKGRGFIRDDNRHEFMFDRHSFTDPVCCEKGTRVSFTVAGTFARNIRPLSSEFNQSENPPSLTSQMREKCDKNAQATVCDNAVSAQNSATNCDQTTLSLTKQESRDDIQILATRLREYNNMKVKMKKVLHS